MSDIVVHVSEPDHPTVHYTEAFVKPEQQKRVTPAKELIPVTPDPGFTLNRVEVEPIPPEYVIPVGTKQINENGEHDVSDFAVAEVAVPPPTLQQKTITPTESEQIVEADTQQGFNALSRVTVNRIPQEYIVPSGTLDITANADGIDVTAKASVNVSVPVPVMPDEYAIGGSLAQRTLTSYHFKNDITKIPLEMFSGCGSLSEIVLPNGVTEIGEAAFYRCSKMTSIVLPNGLTTLNKNVFRYDYILQLTELPTSLSSIGTNCFDECGSITISIVPQGVTSIPAQGFSRCSSLTQLDFLGDITSIGNDAFYNSANILLYKFLHCTTVPPIPHINVFKYINANCKIVVPDDLVTEWKASTNWVTYADKIIGESDYNAKS